MKMLLLAVTNDPRQWDQTISKNTTHLGSASIVPYLLKSEDDDEEMIFCEIQPLIGGHPLSAEENV
ncbi:hypothetical protein Ocin01_14967 [Orchesella cincta]|uniref:Uncharacterized protein n=1 Tax=Orchesella cincta TaxID=48709 RepID=A0A1D2MFE4_ORCCI|nr:hypothetical protein Ocin01_14967 [Orchesella cincta]